MIVIDLFGGFLDNVGWLVMIQRLLVDMQWLLIGMLVRAGKGEGRQFGRPQLAEVFHHPAGVKLGDKLINYTKGTGRSRLSRPALLYGDGVMMAFNGQCI